MRIFPDRAEAGRELGARLGRYRGRDVIVLGLPRGGIPVAREVARALDAPLDVFLVRKLGAPGHEELAMGAIASGGVRVLNEDVISMLGVSEDQIAAVAAREARELERRDREYRGGKPLPELRGRIVILVDDGLATGATMRAAAAAVRASGPARLVVAVPVAARETCEDFRRDPAVDEIECVHTPASFQAVGMWYEDFRQVSDAEVSALLAEAAS
jgi:predicted phosphoribosyltransferase